MGTELTPDDRLCWVDIGHDVVEALSDQPELAQRAGKAFDFVLTLIDLVEVGSENLQTALATIDRQNQELTAALHTIHELREP